VRNIAPTLVSLAFVLSAAEASAQSFNIDFGPTQGAFGLPGPAYAAAGAAGVWNAVGQPSAANLVDRTGAPTNVALLLSGAPEFRECDVAGTTAGDQRLLDDRASWIWQPDMQEARIQGLAAGEYRVLVYALNGCEAFMSGVSVAINGATCGSMSMAWTGSLAEGSTYTLCDATLSTGQDLVLSLCCATLIEDYKLCGLQIERVESTADFCSGDGSALPCPCGNGSGAGSGCLNSTGTGARIVASGSQSVSADDLGFTGFGFVPGKSALLFVGDGLLGAGIVLGDGLRCVSGSIQRLGVRLPDAAGTLTWSSGMQPSGGWAAGDRRGFQAWYRDTLAGPCGSGFNLSQGVDVTFMP
jgi:hypothetical protein